MLFKLSNNNVVHINNQIDVLFMRIYDDSRQSGMMYSESYQTPVSLS